MSDGLLVVVMFASTVCIGSGKIAQPLGKDSTHVDQESQQLSWKL